MRDFAVAALHEGRPEKTVYLSRKSLKMNLTILLGFLGGMGGTEIFLIILVVLLFFGGKRIPELAKGLGKGIKEFKDASKGIDGGDESKKLEEKK